VEGMCTPDWRTSFYCLVDSTIVSQRPHTYAYTYSRAQVFPRYIRKEKQLKMSRCP